MSEVLVIIGVGGMGEAIARRVGAGHTILLADFHAATLSRSVDTLRDEGFSVVGEQVDVADRSSVVTLAQKAASLGAVARVAHTAGLSPSQASARRILEVDLLGVAYSVEEFGKVIAPGGAGIVIASMAGASAADQLGVELQQALATTATDNLLDLPFLADEALPHPGAAYGIAKRANQLRIHAASLQWGARNARINTISPGVISTPMGQQELNSPSGDVMRKMIAESGTHRIGTPTDIAAAAAFLLGPESSFITGTDLLVDGGVTAAVREGRIRFQ